MSPNGTQHSWPRQMRMSRADLYMSKPQILWRHDKVLTCDIVVIVVAVFVQITGLSLHGIGADSSFISRLSDGLSRPLPGTTWIARLTKNNSIFQKGMTSIKRLHLTKQAKPKPIFCMADHRIYCWHSKGLTSWVPLGPRWLEHRWLFVSACPQNMRPPHSML